MDERDPFPDGMLESALEIGAVADGSVRVWLRRPGAGEVTVTLAVDGRAPVTVRVPVSAEADWTAAATLAVDGPAPGAPFVVTAGDDARHGRLAPAPGEHTGFGFVFGSCNSPFGVDKTGRIHTRAVTRIYDAIREEIVARDARLLLLIGDQLYAEGLAPVGVRRGVSEGSPPPDEELIGRYRRATRGFFGEPRFRALRESVPTLCMWDDHDIFDNWGSRREESPLDRALFRAATRVFSEYQFARNVEGHPPAPPFDFFQRAGTTGFLVLDIRGSRSYEEGRLLGAAQWRRLLGFLEGEEAARLHTLFVTTTVPLAHAARWFTLLGQHVPGSYGTAVRDRWASSAFVRSRDEFLNALFRWQDGAPHRQAILLGGDIHEADSARIFRRGGGRPIAQFTSSAMTTRHRGKARLFQYVATRGPNLFEPRFRFERDFLEPRNNAGFVRLDPLPDGGHRVTFDVMVPDEGRTSLRRAHRVVTTPPAAGRAG